jgi:MSHA biogenesis protein MshQ
VTPACGGFTYSGQPFGLKVIAKNAVVDPDPEKTKTKNYAGSFAKNITLSDANGSAGAFSPAVIEASKFTAGIADLTTPASVAFTFANKLTAPATIKVRATDNEASSADGGAEGTTLIRSGRLRLANAHGSELRQLRVPVSAEYWNGTGFVTNPADSCTTVGAVTLNAPPSTCTLTPSVAGVGGTLLSGTAALTLGAPNVRGCADMTMTTPSWLKGNWDGVDQPLPSGDGNIYDDNAAARATFGIFRDRLIFRREVTH